MRVISTLKVLLLLLLLLLLLVLLLLPLLLRLLLLQFCRGSLTLGASSRSTIRTGWETEGGWPAGCVCSLKSSQVLYGFFTAFEDLLGGRGGGLVMSFEKTLLQRCV